MGGLVNVAVLFSDLVGSTALASRVGPEAAEALRREHFALLRGCVERHGGREVKNLGDGLMVAFDAPSAAVAAGVEMQQQLDRRNRVDASAERLTIRVGISSGEADRDDDGDLFGGPVVEAARLCGVGDEDQVLVTEVVTLLIGARGGRDLTPLGPRELKGLPTPMPVWEVGWEPLVEEATSDTGATVPLPGRLAQVTTVFSGRAEQLDSLRTAWKTAAAGGSRGVVVAGEAGIGKTTLLSRFAQEVGAEGGVVTYGRCDEDLGMAYQPWVEALRHLVVHVPDEVLVAHVGDRGAVLSRLVPELGQRVAVPQAVASVDAEADRYLLFGAVADLLGRVASVVGPVLVVLDDLHWTDRPTTQLLRHVLADVGLAGVAVVVTYRPTDVDAGHPLVEALAALRRVEGTEVMDLAGLDDRELMDLLGAAAGHELAAEADALRDALSAETDGNPFFVLEILRHLSETGVLRQDDDGNWGTEVDLRDTGLPVSVRQVVGQRIARLGEPTERVLRQAAVIGRDFDLDLLSELTAIDAEELLDLLEPAMEAAVILNVEADRFSFAHALIEHTLYVDLAPVRRARAHRRVAEVLEARCGDDPGARVGELAHHWAAAVVPDDARKAIEWARRAGDHAREQLAPDEAVRWYTAALELLDDGGRDEPVLRCALLVALGTAERQAGDPVHRQRLLDAGHLAHGLGETELLVSAALQNTRGGSSRIGGIDEERVEVLRLALAAVAADDLGARARLLATLGAEMFWSDEDERSASHAEALDVARATGDPAIIGDVINLRLRSRHLNPLDVAARSRLVAEAVGLTGDDPLRRLALLDQGWLVKIRLGDRVGARVLAEEAVEIARRLAFPSADAEVAALRFVEAMLDGDLPRAEACAEEQLDLGLRLGYPDATETFGIQLTSIRYHQGRFGEVVELLADAAVAAAAAGDPTEVNYRVVLGAFCVGDGQLDRAREIVDAHVDDLDAIRVDDAGMTSIVCFGETALVLGDQRAAARARERLLPYAALIGGISNLTCEGSIAHRLGCLAALLGRRDEAIARLDQALEANRRLESPLHVAATAFELSRMLADRDPSRAATLREEAEALKAACRLDAWPGLTGRWEVPADEGT